MLRSEPTSKSLEKKLLLFGFEVPDVLLIFLLLSVLNFLFGSTAYKFCLIWLPVLVVAATLRIAKRGKPDNYLVHLVKFYRAPKYFSAFENPRVNTSPPKIRRNSK